jgi:hypothetical protein
MVADEVLNNEMSCPITVSRPDYHDTISKAAFLCLSAKCLIAYSSDIPAEDAGKRKSGNGSLGGVTAFGRPFTKSYLYSAHCEGCDDPIASIRGARTLDFRSRVAAAVIAGTATG